MNGTQNFEKPVCVEHDDGRIYFLYTVGVLALITMSQRDPFCSNTTRKSASFCGHNTKIPCLKNNTPLYITTVGFASNPGNSKNLFNNCINIFGVSYGTSRFEYR